MPENYLFGSAPTTTRRVTSGIAIRWTEIHIDYIGAFEDEINNATVNATITHEGDRVHIETEDTDFAFKPGESQDNVRLYSHYTTAASHEREELAFVKHEADDNRISLSWTHNDQHVDAVVLDDTSYDWVIDLLNEARAKQDHLTVAEATAETGVDVPEVPLVVTETTVSRSGWGGGSQSQTETVVELPDDAAVDTETWELWINVVQRAGDHQLTHFKDYMYPPEGQGYEPGDTLSLHEYIDEWHAIDARDIAEEIQLAELELKADLSVGDIMTVANGRYRDDLTERQGVIRDLDESGAEITWDGHNWSQLKRDGDGQLRVGRAGGYSPVRDLEIHRDPAGIDDELLDVREDVMESMEVDQRASAYDVTVERTWETSGAVEADLARDLHAEVTVDGPALDDPVAVHCRNVFDFRPGWTASIKRDLDEDVAAVVRRAARNNSPIPTGVRL
jgi:hypothetical protein